MAADEAIILLDNFLDSAYMGNLPTARIIHGKARAFCARQSTTSFAAANTSNPSVSASTEKARAA